jgi:peptide-methionine (S)-S-oxide reductase
MKIAALIFAVAGLVSAGGCTNPTSTTAVADAGKKEKPMAPATKAELAQWQHATFAGGCFWCEEAVFESIKGVKEVISGYSGGHTENPTYEESGTGRTGHAEAIEIYFDSTVVSFSSLVKVYHGLDRSVSGKWSRTRPWFAVPLHHFLPQSCRKSCSPKRPSRIRA